MANQIHPTAIVDPDAQLGDGITIGPHAIIERDVRIGDGCTLMAGAIIARYTTMGRNNVVHPYTVLGSTPQDFKFDPAKATYLQIGDNNTFREHVSMSRATAPGGATVIGSDCLFMTQSHVGHDSRIGNHVILVNGAAIAGHVEVQDKTILSAHTVVHQFCWLGELVMSRGNSGTSQHVPPFAMLRDINQVTGLNVVGMRRAGYSPQDRLQVKEAYRLLYRSNLLTTKALEEMDRHAEWGVAAGKFRDFVRRAVTAPKPYNRGLAKDVGRAGDEED